MTNRRITDALPVVEPAAAASANGNSPDGDNGWATPVPIDAVVRPKLPMWAIPSILRDAIDHIASTRMCAPEIPLCGYLGAISGIFAEFATVTIDINWINPLNLYCLVIADTGDGKTPGMKPGIALAKAVSRLRQTENINKVREAKGRLALLKKAQKKEEGEDKPDPAVLAANIGLIEECQEAIRSTGRCDVSDATPEAMAALLHRNGGLLLMVDSEGTVVQHVLGIYSGRPNLALLLSGWDASDYSRDRVGTGGVPTEAVIDKVILSIGAAVQPIVWTNLLADQVAVERGVAARFLTAWPATMVGHRKMGARPESRESLSAIEDLRSRVESIRQTLAGRLAPDATPQERFLGTKLKLSPEALERFAGWHDTMEDGLADLEGHVRNSVPKIRGSVARIAGIFHLLKMRPGFQIDLETMEEAIALGDFFMGHAIDEVDAVVVADARRVLAWILANTTATEHGSRFTTVREINRGVGNYKVSGGTDKTIAALRFLADRSWLAATDTKDGFGSGARNVGKCTPLVEVNPMAEDSVED